MSLIPTKDAVIGQYINGRNATDDFLQLATNHGGTVFGWIDASGLLQGTLANISVASISGVLKAGTGITFTPTGTTLTISSTSTSNPGGATTDVQINNAGVFYGDGNFTYNPTPMPEVTIAGVSNSSLDPSIFSTIISQTASLAVTGVINGVTGPQYPIIVMGQSTNNTATSGIYSTALAEGTADSNMFPIEADCYSAPSVAATQTFNASIVTYASNNGPGVVQKMASVIGETDCSGGTTDINMSFWAIGAHNAGVMHNNYGFHSDSQAGQGDTLNAAFHADAQTISATNFAFYSASANNYFGGTATTAAVQITNSTVATSLLNQNSPLLELSGTFWNGSASAADSWTIQNVLGTGTNPTSTVTFAHVGSSGTLAFSLPGSLSTGVINSPGATFGANGVNILDSSSLNFAGSASGSAAISVAAAAGTPNTLLLPITTGSSGQVLTTNGANPQQLSWTSGTTTIASGTATLGTTLITSGSKATLVTVSATGTLATDTIMADFNADPSGTTGYAPSVNGMLTIIKYPTADNVNFWVYNNTGASITPGSVTLNWRVVR